jgi:hypothetical protein
MPRVAVHKGFQHLAHRLEMRAIEPRPQALPHQALAPQFRPDRSASGTAPLLGVVHQTRPRHDRGQHHGQLLRAMAVVVLKVIALIFQRLARRICHLPPRPASTHEPRDIPLAHPHVRDPPAVVDVVLATLPILDAMDPSVRSRGLERDVVHKANPRHHPRGAVMPVVRRFPENILPTASPQRGEVCRVVQGKFFFGNRLSCHTSRAQRVRPPAPAGTARHDRLL